MAFVAGRWTIEDSTPRGLPAGVPSSFHGRPLVLDGDSLEVQGHRVRLFGIDAFERDQFCEHADGRRFACGQLARESLQAAIGPSMVRCVGRDVDRYDRVVATCYAGERDVAGAVVHDGFALAYRRYSMAYVDEEDTARIAGRGAWGGRFDKPWDYRYAARTARQP